MAQNRFERQLTGRVTKKRQNWYLRGWEYQDVTGENGAVRRRLVYTREYYRLSEPAKRTRYKLMAAELYLILCGSYIALETTRAQGGFVWYAGAPALLAVIPIFYLGLGVFNFILSEKYFTYRRMWAAYTRLRIGGAFAAALLGVGFAGQTIFICIYGKALRLGPELVMLFGALIGALCAAGLLLLRKRARCEEVSAKEYPGQNR